MKGLLIKDFNFLKRQKQFLLTICGFGIFFSITGDTPAFAMTYMAVLIASFAVGTLNYDEFENGGAYLFTLPISRKEYVREKYIFAMLAAMVAMMVAFVFLIAMIAVRNLNITGEEILIYVVTSLITSMVIVAVVFPMQIKFGPEKSRLAIMGMVVGAIAMIFLLAKIGKNLFHGSGNMMSGFSQFFIKAGVIGIAGCVLLAGIVALLFSFQLSVKFMEKKEY